MRERLAAAFIALAVSVLLLAAVLRVFALDSLFRDETRSHLTDSAALISVALDERSAAGRPVDRRFVEQIVPPDARLELETSGGAAPIVVEGASHAGHAEDEVVVSEESSAGTVTLSATADGPGPFLARDVWSVLVLGLLAVLLAGLAGWWIAVRLSAPFQKLAVAAAALGRGRFDLTLPETPVPEARAIAQALRVSAAQLEARLSRERDFAEHASHVLRTPLTSLRLELEDLALREDVPPDARAAAARCMERVEAVNVSAGELVALSRSGALMEGAEMTLAELAHLVAQGWTDQLTGRRRVSAAVEGDLEMRFTPGPLEQLLDLVLTDVKRGAGPVRMTFVGDDGFVRVMFTGGSVPLTLGARTGLDAAAVLAESQGGRVRTDSETGEIELLLPRR